MNEIEVQVDEGGLTGVVVDGYNVRYFAFRGIPYAEPPIGELRFKDPVPVKPWYGNRDASKYGNSAVQVNIFTREIEGDEDCLYLNVFTTKISPCEKRAVMVWIHGGGYFTGSGNADFYGPDYIMPKDVVLVTVNYRLDVLGFLNLYDKVATGNQGLKDVVLALNWVRNNILNFGGDPDNVTIFGESAGAAMVHFLALSPLAKGLFHKGIAQSGAAINPWALLEGKNEAQSNGFQLAEKLGKTTLDPKVAYEFLKTVDAKELVKQAQILLANVRLSFSLTFTPSLDYESSKPFFPKHLNKYINQGIQMPFLLGFNRNEGHFFISGKFFGDVTKTQLEQVNANFSKAIILQVLSKLPEMGITVEELRSLYFGENEISEKTLMFHSNFIGDEFFKRGIIDAVKIQKSTGNYKSTYLYHFDYESDTSIMKRIFNIRLPGVAHTEELCYLFSPEISKLLKLSLPSFDSEDYQIINQLTQMWTDFAKTGNPTPITNLWSPLTGPQNEDYNYLNINLNSQMKSFHKGKESWDWENLIKK